MPRRSCPKPSDPASSTGAARRLRVLLVDGDRATGHLLAQVIQRNDGDLKDLELKHATTLREARNWLSSARPDVILVEPKLRDGSGMALAQQLRSRPSAPQTIVISDNPSVDTALAAMRSGASDLLVKPLRPQEVAQRLNEAIHRLRTDRRDRRRLRRLRRVCEKLSRSRQDVARQVDVLCKDLVVAYQELADQMQSVVYSSEFAATIRNELDLEQVIRKVLEYVLDKAGPTNAAIFLPTHADEYTLGGYVNYDAPGGSPDLLLQHLADVAVPAVADRAGSFVITDNEAMQAWLGDDAAYLADAHVVGVACRHEEEALAVIILFRDGSQPYDNAVVASCEALGPLLATHLARIIRIHHRHLPELELDEDDTGGEPVG